MEDDYRVKGFHSKMKELDELVLENAFKNCLKWLGRKHKNRDATEAMLHRNVKQYLEKEINKETLKLMKNIKKQFDPKNILNTNKSI